MNNVDLGIILAVKFGSKAGGVSDKDSDFDIAVLVKNKPDYKMLSKLYEYFSDRFPAEKVDLRFLNKCDPFFAYQVFENGELLMGDVDVFLERKLLAHKMYVDDVLYYEKMREKLFKKRLKSLKD